MRKSIRSFLFNRLTAQLGVLVCFAAFLPAVMAQTAPDLLTAKSFGVFAAAAVSNTGPSTVHGDLGLSPNGPTSVTGISGLPTPGQVVAPGTIHAADAIALQARNDLTAAYDSLGTQGSTASLTGQDLGGLTLTAGVYDFSSSAQLTGTLTLSGTANSVFIFRMGSTLTTASASNVKLIGGAQSCNVFWKVGSSATLGTATSFIGTILADTSITLTTGANVNGRILAGAKTLSGAVTLDTNNIFFSSCVSGTTNGEGNPNPNPGIGPIPGAGPGPVGTPDSPPVNAPPMVCTDTTPPTVTSQLLSNPFRTVLTVTDSGSGLAAIVVTGAGNVDVDIQSFAPGTTAPVLVTATRRYVGQTWIGIKATDLCGNVTQYDPTALELKITRGAGVPVTLTGISRSEHFIDVTNGRPGLNQITINVNGTNFESGRLMDGQTATVNIGPAMNRGTNNTITFEFRGQPGDSATVFVRP